MPKLVIFDNDGVLVDSEVLYAKVSAELYPKFGYNMTEQEYYKRWAAVRTKEKLVTIEEETGVKINYDEFYPIFNDLLAKRFKTNLEATAGTAVTLPALENKYCVASSAPVDRILQGYKTAEIDANFIKNQVFSATMVKKGKPAPDLFLYAAEKMGYKPSDCIVIEDSVAGITAAKAANMQVFGFTGGSHAKALEYATKLKKAGANLIFNDMQQLPSLLEKFN